MATRTAEPPLDEIQWRDPYKAAEMQGIHNNSVLHYFAESPFFDRMSNNAVIASQANFNYGMYEACLTRESFEARLKSMSGLEFVVAQEPAETAPGTGTGVWVIRKQTRKKHPRGEDEIIAHSTYYVIGDSIYMAPTLADVMSFRLTAISTSLRKCLPIAQSVQTWTPATGHFYKTPKSASSSAQRSRALGSKETTPMPDSQQQANGTKESNNLAAPDQQTPDRRLAEQSFAMHMEYGGEYMDENPITGKPGQFHLSSTGRKDQFSQNRLGVPNINTKVPAPTAAKTSITNIKGSTNSIDNLGKGVGAGGEKSAASTPRTPKTPTGGGSKPKRKKSKGPGATGAPTPTPNSAS